MNESKVTLFLSRNKALALLSVLPSALETVRQEVIEHNYDTNCVEMYCYLDSVYYDLTKAILEKNDGVR